MKKVLQTRTLTIVGLQTSFWYTEDYPVNVGVLVRILTECQKILQTRLTEICYPEKR